LLYDASERIINTARHSYCILLYHALAMIKPSVYKLGTQPPTLKTDPGAGAWNSTPASLEMKALKEVLQNSLTQGLAVYFGGQDAVDHIEHYLGNTGTTYTVKFQKLIKEVPPAKGKDVVDAQIAAAQKFIETLPPGSHFFTSDTGSLNHAISRSDSVNWFFAVGSYTTWGSGIARVSPGGTGKINYSMDFELHFFDRYNWDGGKMVQIPLPGYGKLPKIVQDQINKLPNVSNGQLKVTDHFMGEFHRMGLAKEFDMEASFKTHIDWRPSTGFVLYKVKSGDSLSKIAKQYYGNMDWHPIHKENKAKIPNPDLIQVGMELKIPA